MPNKQASITAYVFTLPQGRDSRLIDKFAALD
jgi:hypothetical protein